MSLGELKSVLCPQDLRSYVKLRIEIAKLVNLLWVITCALITRFKNDTWGLSNLLKPLPRKRVILYDFDDVASNECYLDIECR